MHVADRMVMKSNVRPSLPLVFMFGALLCGAAGAAPVADPPASAQIYQQRGADGRIVLTDRPSPSAVTERSWQMEREDPQAAQRRALEMRREANAVSERVQRRIEAQERSAAESDLERMRLAQRDREFQLLLARSDSDYDRVPVVFVPLAKRPFSSRTAPSFEHRPPPRRPARMSHVSGSTSLENR